MLVLILVTVQYIVLIININHSCMLTHHVGWIVLTSFVQGLLGSLVLRCADPCFHSRRGKWISIGYRLHCIGQLVILYFILRSWVIVLLMDALHCVSILAVAWILEQYSHFIAEIGYSREEAILGILLGCVAVGAWYIKVLLILLEHHLLIHLCLGWFELLLRGYLLIVIQLIGTGWVLPIGVWIILNCLTIGIGIDGDICAYHTHSLHILLQCAAHASPHEHHLIVGGLVQGRLVSYQVGHAAQGCCRLGPICWTIIVNAPDYLCLIIICFILELALLKDAFSSLEVRGDLHRAVGVLLVREGVGVLDAADVGLTLLLGDGNDNSSSWLQSIIFGLHLLLMRKLLVTIHYSTHLLLMLKLLMYYNLSISWNLLLLLRDTLTS